MLAESSGSCYALSRALSLRSVHTNGVFGVPRRPLLDQAKPSHFGVHVVGPLNAIAKLEPGKYAANPKPVEMPITRAS